MQQDPAIWRAGRERAGAIKPRLPMRGGCSGCRAAATLAALRVRCGAHSLALARVPARPSRAALRRARALALRLLPSAELCQAEARPRTGQAQLSWIAGAAQVQSWRPG